MNRSWGEPLLMPDLTTPNVALLQKLARHDTITLDIAPWFSLDGPFKAEPILLLRRYNPRIRILPYYLVCHTWLTPGNRPAPSFNRSVYDLLSANDGWVKNPDGSLVSGGWANQSKRVISDGYTDLFRRVMTCGLFDRGIFLDYLTMGWIGGNDDAALRFENMQRMVHALQQHGVVIGNGIYADKLGVDGSMIEGFGILGPLAQFETARKAWQEGYQEDSWLQVSAFDNTSENAKRAARYGIAVAALFGANVSVGYDRNQQVRYHEWWWDEFDVQMGDPLGPARKLASGAWRRDFTHGCVLVNPRTDTDVIVALGPGWPSPFASVLPQDAVFAMVTARREVLS